jgi:hypothetical protein
VESKEIAEAKHYFARHGHGIDPLLRILKAETSDELVKWMPDARSALSASWLLEHMSLINDAVLQRDRAEMTAVLFMAMRSSVDFRNKVMAAGSPVARVTANQFLDHRCAQLEEYFILGLTIDGGMCNRPSERIASSMADFGVVLAQEYVKC